MIRILHEGDPGRKESEAFIRDVFRRSYGANIETFMPHLIEVRDRQGEISAVVGYRDAEHHPLFLEVYLDEPVEQALSNYLGHQVERASIVEVGNLAEAKPGDARMAIIAATAYLREAGYDWVVFTGVIKLRNAFRKLGLVPKELQEADIHRLPQQERERWGTYYGDRPVVCFGDIRNGYDSLQELWAMLRDTWAEAVEAGQRQRLLRQRGAS
ncbi:MAG: hypothetical protein D6703_07335 [Zetaproteobacteria bacterium]|nr:MAG: hypothetical protein D6703_07335 [Zetaproteobacteria bacterium]